MINELLHKIYFSTIINPDHYLSTFSYLQSIQWVYMEYPLHDFIFNRPKNGVWLRNAVSLAHTGGR